MINKVKHFIEKNKLLNKKDKVLVALSGGPDSICLLHILYSLKDDMKLEIGAAHINHMLRGDDALEDEIYVKEFCEKLGIPCYIDRIDIDRISKEKGISHEMAGREERYKFFEEIKSSKGYNKIAIAHNANDQAETVIMRMMRGAGLEGLCGIRVERDNKFIRPILCLNRKEIESYCKLNNLNARIDKTNLEKIYSRNKVRLDILPYMKKNFNKDIIDTINRMATLLQKDNEFIENKANEAYEKNCTEKNGDLVICRELFSLEEALITRVIKKAFIVYSKKYTNFEMKHIYEVIELSKIGTNKKVDLPNEIFAENIYGNIYLKKRLNVDINKNNQIYLSRDALEGLSAEFGEYNVRFKIITNKNNLEFSDNVLIKYFDYDKIKEGLYIRTRKDGDKIKPLGMKGSKKLKDIFINMKVPRENRLTVPIVCFDNEISWVVGYKVSEDFKITKETKNIIKITFSRKE